MWVLLVTVWFAGAGGGPGGAGYELQATGKR